MAYTKAQAIAVARAIKSGSQVFGNVYNFGSSFHSSEGRNIDIIVEVPTPLFRRYQEECDFSGVPPILLGIYNPDDFSPKSLSPVERRSESALGLIGIERDLILKTDGMNMPCRDLDVICLPVDWNTSPLLEKLQAEVSANWQCDPSFMENLHQLAVLVE